MKHIRALALAVLAVVALAASPTAASAFDGFEAESYPASLEGQAVGTLYVHVPGGPTFSDCAPDFASTMEAASPSVTSTSTTTNCGLSSQWDMQDCQLTFDPYSETVDIGPAECGPTKLATGGFCGWFEIGPQDGLHAEYNNTTSEGKDAVSIELLADDVTYTRSLSWYCGKAGTYNDLSLTGTWTVTAADSEEEAIGVSLYRLPHGIYMAGGPAEFETGEPRLDSDHFPVDVVGERWDIGEAVEGKLIVFERGSVKAECPSGDFSVGEIAEPLFGDLAIDAEYPAKSCPVQGLGSGSVSMNTCQYVISDIEQVVEGGEGTSQYEGTPKIDCAAEGDAIEVIAPGCTISLPSQTLSEPVPVLQNYDEGYESVIGSIMAGSSVNFTTNNTLACKIAGLPAAGEDGSLESDVLLQGVIPG